MAPTTRRDTGTILAAATANPPGPAMQRLLASRSDDELMEALDRIRFDTPSRVEECITWEYARRCSLEQDAAEAWHGNDRD